MITVLMCTYKEKEEHLRKAIESILDQTIKNFEFLIVIDNPKNLEHRRIVEAYATSDDRINVFINKKNIGLPQSLNKGLLLAKGDLIARMDADDIAIPERLEREFEFLTQNPSYKVISVNKVIIDENDKEISRGSELPSDFSLTREAMMYTNIVLHPGCMFYKNFILKLGGYREINAAEDYDLWLRVISSGNQIGFVDENLMKYRMSNGNTSSSNAYIMWCSHQYVRTLYLERMENGQDSYSEEKYLLYMESKKIDDRRKNERFNKGVALYNKARYLLKEKKYIRAITMLGKAWIKDDEMPAFIKNAFSYKKVMSQRKGR